MFELGDAFKDHLTSHLNGELMISSLTSWTHSLLAVLSRAYSLTGEVSTEEIFISIMITSCFEDKEIYYVPDILRVGLGMDPSNHGGYYHEYVVNGPISGPGLAAIKLSELMQSMGSLWSETPDSDGWYKCYEEMINVFQAQRAGTFIDDQFEDCVRAVQGSILPAFVQQQIDLGAFKLMELYITAQFYCMRKHIWFGRLPNDLDPKWVAAMTETSTSGGLSEMQRNWCGGIIPRIHAAIQPRRTETFIKHSPDVQQTLFLVGHFGRTLMDYGKTLTASSPAVGTLGELSSDNLLGYLGVMVSLTNQTSDSKYWLSKGWKDPKVNYWVKFRARQS